MFYLIAQVVEQASDFLSQEVLVGLIVGGGVSIPTVGTTIAVMKSQMKHLRADLERNRNHLIEIRQEQQQERLDVHERLVKLETLIIKNGNGKH